MAKFSDVAEQAAIGNPIKIQRHQGELVTTLVDGVKLGDFGADSAVVYLCPIPWYARLVNISVLYDAAAKYVTTVPLGTLSVRSMKNRGTQKTTSGLEYEKILGTTADYAAATDHKTLSGWTLSNNNTTEIGLMSDINIMGVAANSAVTKDVETFIPLPYGVRINTIAECYSYKNSDNRVLFTDNAKEWASKEQFGMLTWATTTAGVGDLTDANMAIQVTYVAPSPSGVAQGTINRR